MVGQERMDEVMTHLERVEQTLRFVAGVAARMHAGEITREQALELLTQQPGGFASRTRAAKVLDAAPRQIAAPASLADAEDR